MNDPSGSGKSVDLTCLMCKGRGTHASYAGPCRSCPFCYGTGRREPTLHEWDALEAERDTAQQAYTSLAVVFDRYHEALERIFNMAIGPSHTRDVARAALDPEHDLAERTRRIKADE